MSDEYQLRKDIDRLIRDVYDLNSGALRLTTTDEFDKLVDRLDSDNSLDVLETNLISFKGNLDDFNTSLISFESDLEEYGGELGTFSGQLSGFTTAINNLKNWMYGYNPLDPTITYENPSSDSIKGMIGVLQGLLEQLEAGDGIVLENLGRLKDHLQAFSGTLAEFKQYLTNQGVDVSTLDDSVLSLILEINKNIAVIDEHEQTINEVDQTIGNPATATTPATGFYKKFDDGDAIMEDLDDRAEDLEVTINGDPDDPTDTGLKGSTEEMIITVKGDPDDPTDNGLIGETQDIIDTIGEPAVGQQSATGLHLLIDNAQETANAVDGVATLIKEKIGYNSIPDESPLQSQITAQGNKIGTVPSGQTLQGQITANTGDISDIQGDIGTVPSGKTLQGQITTIEDNAPVIITDFFLSDSITGAIQRVNKSLWNVGDNIWILFKLLKNNSTYQPTSTEFPITIFTPSGQSSTIYRYRRIPDGTVSGYLEVYKYTISESGLHLMVLNGKTYPINVDNFSKYTLSTFDTMDYDANFNTCDVTFSKQNHLVVCTYHISTTTYANKNDHTLTTSIPSAYRPSSVFYQDICTYGGQKLDGLITVGTDGSMKIRMGTANTSMNVYGSFTYIV